MKILSPEIPSIKRGGAKRRGVCRAASRLTLAALLLLALTSCASGPKGPTAAQLSAAQQQAASENIPPALQSLYVDMITQGERQYVLNAMKLGLSAAASGYNDLAKRVFDQAIKREQALQDGAEQAERTKSKFVPEEEKWFKGEAYERAALYIFRGVLYVIDGDYGNAAACAKRAQLEDLASKEQNSGDLYSAEWLLAFASLKQRDPGTASEALARAAKFPNRQGTVPPPQLEDNVLIVGDAGAAPVKVGIGEYHEKLTFVPGECKTTHLVIESTPTGPVTVDPAENFYVQATTRGDRKVDYILKGKAEFKSATDTAGNAAIVAGAATALTSGGNDTQALVGIGLVAAGLISKGVSAGANPAADTRMWDNLPSNLFFYSLKCPPGASTLTIRALGAGGKIVKVETREIVINPQQPAPVVLWLTLP